MFAPPPAPALSRAEIEARRARNTTIQIRPARPHKPIPEQSEVLPGALARKLATFALGKEKEKTRFEISAPLPSAPPARPLPSTPAYGQLSQRDIYNGKPLPPPPVPSAHTMNEISTSRPIRPPRPVRGLSIQGQIKAEISRGSVDNAAQSSGYQTAIASASSTTARVVRPSVYKSRVAKTTTKRLSGSSTFEQHISRNKAAVTRRAIAKHHRPSSIEAALLEFDGTPASSRSERSPQQINVKQVIETSSAPQACTESPSQDITVDQIINTSLTSCASTKRPSEDAIVKQIVDIPLASSDYGTLQTSNSLQKTPLELYTAKQSHVSADLHLTPYGLPATTQQKLNNRASTISVVTPVRTHIHLRGGSVITVTPPELTAWKRAVYIQGPIRFTRTNMTQRKNSLASLDAFQDALEAIPSRRQSDDAASKDICDYFKDFGTCDVFEYAIESGVGSADELDTESDEEVDEYATPLTMERSSPRPPSDTIVFPLPPLQTEESLRIRGIARLQRRAPNDDTSITSLE